MNLMPPQQAPKKDRGYRRTTRSNSAMSLIQIAGQELLDLTGLSKVALVSPLFLFLNSPKKIRIDCHKFVCMSGLPFVPKRGRTIITDYVSSYCSRVMDKILLAQVRLFAMLIKVIP